MDYDFIDDEPLTSSIDKEEYLDMMSTSDAIFWDQVKYTFHEFRRLLSEALDETIESYTHDGVFYVDDWDAFDNETRLLANEKLGNS